MDPYHFYLQPLWGWVSGEGPFPGSLLMFSLSWSVACRVTDWSVLCVSQPQRIDYLFMMRLLPSHIDERKIQRCTRCEFSSPFFSYVSFLLAVI